MNSYPLVTLLVPTLVAVVSWFAGSWLSAKRDRANKRRELRVQYLIEAYRRLSSATSRQLSAEHFAAMDSAIVDVQLFGSPDQILAAHMFAKHLAEHREAQLDKLLASLRNDLRAELKLENVEGPLVVLRPNFASKEEK